MDEKWSAKLKRADCATLREWQRLLSKYAHRADHRHLSVDVISALHSDDTRPEGRRSNPERTYQLVGRFAR